MAGSQQYAVGTAPTLLASCPSTVTPGPLGWFYFTNGTAATVYLGGGTGVTSSNGASLAASTTLTGYLFAGDNLYAVTASGTSTVGVLQTGL